MKAPENPNKRQRVFVVSGVDHKSMRLIFKVFSLNSEMRTELSLTQYHTKIEPFGH